MTKQLADACRPSNKLVFGKGDQELPKIEFPTKDHLGLGESSLCHQLVSCVHAFARDWLLQMIWLSADVDGKEGGRLSPSDVVYPRDVHHQVDDVINVEAVHLVGVNGDVNNQLCSFSKRGAVIEGPLFWNQMFVWGKEVIGVPIIIVQDCIC